MPTDTMSELLGDLEAEQALLTDVLETLDRDDWFRPTPAWSWDVRDTIAHLADTDELAIDTCLDGPRSLTAFSAQCASPEDLTFAGVLKGRRLAGLDVLAWWQETQAREREVLRSLDPDGRVPWGLGMRSTSFVVARLMEAWAHSLDVHAALDAPFADTDRLRHVAWIGTRALPYAYSVAGVEAPAEPLRVELSLPSGASWTYGPETASDRIVGPASEYCRVFVQRLRPEEAPNLTTTGAGARRSLGVARSFL
ncbi:MAG TPA: maleylpyruvate isomerase family mycothiol-dependent enzyme [Acidimicrobiia bacterium]|jgi:uncharacterized protein (TIGR03084 family)